jgi:ArsR family transcriptional regulator
MKNLFSVFSNYNRVVIIACLYERDKNVTQLIENCGVSQSAISQHLKKLKDLEIITSRKNGKERIYSLLHQETGKICKNILNIN